MQNLNIDKDIGQQRCRTPTQLNNRSKGCSFDRKSPSKPADKQVVHTSMSSHIDNAAVEPLLLAQRRTHAIGIGPTNKKIGCNKHPSSSSTICLRLHYIRNKTTRST
eukprot:scaffold749_cov90-Skeletonema_dohrnii-CCMP3373.AAC.8